jgi:hypothetical protein
MTKRRVPPNLGTVGTRLWRDLTCLVGCRPRGLSSFASVWLFSASSRTGSVSIVVVGRRRRWWSEGRAAHSVFPGCGRRE